MKIDFDMLEKMVSAGATGGVVVAYLREQDTRLEPKRARDRKGAAARRGRHKATNGDSETTPSDTERQKATMSDTPRARLFREGTAALVSLNRTERAARQLIATWLKITHDDDQLVLATILRARDLAVADVAGWVLATLKGKANGKSGRNKSLSSAGDDLIARAAGFGGEGPIIDLVVSDAGSDPRQEDHR